MTKKKLFWFSFLVSTVGFSAEMYLHRPPPRPDLKRIDPRVFLTSQLKPENIRDIRRMAISTVVDFRPDGEEKGQPSSSEMELAATQNHMSFHYIPVPHESIPDSAVNALQQVLDQDPRRTVLYCRSGRRAVRTFALAEASLADGPTAEEIMAMVTTAGFSADDLKGNIAERIAHRNPPSPEKKE